MRYQFIVRVNIENAAFFADSGRGTGSEWKHETARILGTVAELLKSPNGAESGSCIDSNGNTCGRYGINVPESVERG